MRASYSTYKSTSIPWPESIPESWELVKISSVFRERRETVSDKDFAPLSVTMQGIVPQLETAAKTDNGDNRKKVCAGDFVINSRSDRKGSAGISPLDGSVSVISIVLKPLKRLHERYIDYLLTNYYFQEEFYRYGKGIVADLWSTKYSNMKGMFIPLPSLEEQTAIANYLDAKTEQINRFIEKKEKLIALLKEQKQAVINELMEDKEGKWERRKLKYCVKSIVSGGTPSMDNKLFWQNGIIPWVSPKDMKVMFINNTEMNVTELAVNSTVLKIIPSGSILIVVRSGILQRTIPIAFNSVPVTVNQDLKAITLNDRIIDPLYFYYFVKGFEKKILSLCRKVVATVDSLEMTDLLNYKLIVPPIEKQRELTLMTKDSLQRIDKTISQIEKEIEKVKELKQSLIAEVVTGKIKVV